MTVEEIIEIKNHILEEGKEYRKNILFYLKWVLKDFEVRRKTKYKAPIFNLNVLGIRTEKEWKKVRDKDYLIEHGESGNRIVSYSSNDINQLINIILESCTVGFKELFNAYIPSDDFDFNDINGFLIFNKITPDENHYIRAINYYNILRNTNEILEYDGSNTANYNLIQLIENPINQVSYNNETFEKKILSRIAYSIANNLGENEMTAAQLISQNSLDNVPDIFTEVDSNEIINIKPEDNQMKEINEYVKLLETQKQIILQGPPGTGKTRLAKIIARNILKAEFEPEIDDLKEHVKLIQFHPSYSYEDFVRGITAKTTDQGIEYEVENKILAQMAKDALEDKENIYILIIDEINRANLSSVLGELIYALEYRDQAVESMYELKEENKKKSREITLPSNLYIIGTMNTADRSIGHIDYAIRRRFSFSDVLPDSSVVDVNSKFLEVEKIFEKYTSAEFEKNKVMLGHSYFIADNNNDKLKSKLDYQVIPLLEEYISDGVLNIDETTWKELKTDLLGN